MPLTLYPPSSLNLYDFCPALPIGTERGPMKGKGMKGKTYRPSPSGILESEKKVAFLF